MQNHGLPTDVGLKLLTYLGEFLFSADEALGFRSLGNAEVDCESLLVIIGPSYAKSTVATDRVYIK